MHRILLVVTFFQLLCITGCSMDPPYERPQVTVPQTLSVKKEQGGACLVDEKQNTVSQNVSWRNFFISHNIRDVIQTALKNNQDLRIAILNVEAVRALYRVQSANLVPSLGLQFEGDIQTTSSATNSETVLGANALLNSGKNNTTQQYSTGLAVTAFEIDLFGHVRSDVRSAFESYLAEQDFCRAAHVSLIATVAGMYVQLLADTNLLQIAEQMLDAYERSLNFVKSQYGIGIVSKADLLNAEKMLNDAKNSKVMYKKLVEQDKNALHKLIGKYDDDLVVPNQTLETVKIMQNLPTDISSQVLLLRPDVKVAEHQILAANANIGSARSAFFPTINLTAIYGSTSQAISALFGATSVNGLHITPTASMTLFDGGRKSANLSSAIVKKEIAITNYRKTVQNAFKEVADALSAYRASFKQLQTQYELVTESKQAYELSYAKYKHGVDRMLSALNMEIMMYVAQQNEISAKKQFITTIINLYKTLGGGVDSSMQCSK